MLFGLIVEGDQKKIVRIPQSEDVDKENQAKFADQALWFFSEEGEERKKIEFQPGQTQTEENVLYIDEFDDDLMVKEAVKPGIKLDSINFRRQLPFLKSIFMVDPGKPGRILFQLMEGRRIITPGWIGVILSGVNVGDSNTLSHMDSAGISLDSKLTAVMEDGRLYFKSFRNASRIFNLSGYLEDASVEGTVAFLNSPSLCMEGTPEEMAESFTKSQLRKVPKIKAYGYLEKYAPTELQRRAARVKPKISLEIKDNKLVVPTDKDARVALLDFLSNTILSSHLDDGTDYKSESHYPIKKDVKSKESC